MSVRARSSLIAVAILLSLAASCPPQGLDPAARDAWVANEVSIRLVNLQQAAIEANTAGLIEDTLAITIVRYTVSSLRICQDLPAGWLQSLLTATREVQRLVLQDTYSAGGVALDAIEQFLMASGGRDGE